MWAKQHDGVRCLQAHDFETAPIDLQARNNLQNKDRRLRPYVPLTMEYVEPQPGRELNGRGPHMVDIPAEPIAVNLTPTHGINRPIPNLQLNLTCLARAAQCNLPDHGVTLV